MHAYGTRPVTDTIPNETLRIILLLMERAMHLETQKNSICICEAEMHVLLSILI